MKRKLKRGLFLLTAVMLTVFTMMSTCLPVFAEGEDNIWQVGWTKNSTISVDAKTYYKESRYSIKLANSKEYGYCYAKKAITLEPLTTYRFSAMVKYSDYKLAPDAQLKNTGASMCISNEKGTVYASSPRTNSSEWTKLEFLYTTKADRTSYRLALWNGDQKANCAGNAWFSDLKIEKAELTDQWNVLTVICKNIDADLDLTGKDLTIKADKNGKSHLNRTFDDAAVKNIKKMTDRIYDTFETLSGGMMDIKDIDYVEIDEPITKLYDNGTGFFIDTDNGRAAKYIDKYLEKKHYQQIIVFSPLQSVTGKIAGIGGSKHNNTHICQLFCASDGYPYKEKDGFDDVTIVHEILHGLEWDSKIIDASKVDSIHNAEQYGYVYNSPKWFSDYLQRKLPNGKGIDPKAFYRLSGEYTLVDNDMTSGGLIEQSSAFPLPLSKVKLIEIKDQSYTGKQIKPDVTLKDGNYTLKNEIDYTVSYKNNKNVGTATVAIKGKGLYNGSISTKFNIVKKTLSTKVPVVKATRKENKIKLSWDKVEGADKYIIWVSKNGKDFTQLKELDGSKQSISIKCSNKIKYRFAVTAYIPELNEYTSYGYSKAV